MAPFIIPDFMNREIGQFFRNIRHSSVTRVWERFEEAMASDKPLSENLYRIVRAISNSLADSTY